MQTFESLECGEKVIGKGSACRLNLCTLLLFQNHSHQTLKCGIVIRTHEDSLGYLIFHDRRLLQLFVQLTSQQLFQSQSAHLLPRKGKLTLLYE